MGIEARIAEHLDQLFSTELTGLFPVEIEIGKGKVQVFVDGDEGVTIDQCKTINRYLRRAMEEVEDFGKNYALEVSSPGATKPLKLWRQYHKHAGRILEFKLKDGSTKTGKLKELLATDLIIEISADKDTEEIQIPFGEIEESLVQISFN